MSEMPHGETKLPGARGTFLARRGTLLLMLSLALNLLVVGAIAGAAFLHRRPAFEPVFAGAALAPGELFGFVRTLPPERRRAIRQAFVSERSKFQELRGGVQRVRDELSTLLTAEPLDRAALDGATQRLWTAEGELRRAQLSSMVVMAGILTQPERARFIAWRKSRWPGAAGHHRPGPPETESGARP